LNNVPIPRFSIRADAVAEVDHPCQRMQGLAGIIAPFNRNAATDKTVELAVVLQERAGEVAPRQLLNGLLPRRCG